MKDLTEFDRGYLSGLIDGEGCIGLYRKTIKGKRTYARTLIINMTHKETIFHVKYIVGEGSIHFRPRKKPHHKDCWVYTLAGFGMDELLPKLDLITKAQDKNKALKVKRKRRINKKPEIKYSSGLFEYLGGPVIVLPKEYVDDLGWTRQDTIEIKKAKGRALLLQNIRNGPKEKNLSGPSMNAEI